MKEVGAREKTIASTSTGVIPAAFRAPTAACCACSTKVCRRSRSAKGVWEVLMTATGSGIVRSGSLEDHHDASLQGESVARLCRRSTGARHLDLTVVARVLQH